MLCEDVLQVGLARHQNGMSLDVGYYYVDFAPMFRPKRLEENLPC